MADKKLTDYEKYIRTEELLALQKSPDQMVHPDELLFQVIHQQMELWLKEVCFECERITGQIDREELDQASHYLHRVSMTLDHLARSLGILETMPPADYHVIRLTALGKGSGQESPGFNAVLERLPGLWPNYQALLERRKATLPEIFREPHKRWDLWNVTQALMGVDESFQSWRYHHFHLVRRIIGDQVKSLKGVPASMLAQTTTEKVYPQLWQAVNDLTRAVSPQYG
ncbi:MAG: tryptophan 2,3-dioxygenase [Planctomycetes bacterium]|nr:tryptophan 2,3-dioxygenase [Planctomycetota bacterium]